MRSHGRRQFLQGGVVLAGFSLLSGREVPGQQVAKVPRIGSLAVGSREGRAFMIEGFRQGLREHGYVEGQSIVVEYRFSEDRDDRLPALAAELVALKVQLILASGTPASFAAKHATSTIPIVMGGIAADPVETGLVASLARPGGNITGMSMMTAPLGGKRLELLKRTVPSLARVAVFWNPPNPSYGPILKELEAAAPASHVGRSITPRAGAPAHLIRTRVPCRPRTDSGEERFSLPDQASRRCSSTAMRAWSAATCCLRSARSRSTISRRPCSSVSRASMRRSACVIARYS
jgi:ABC transporter substrate binding protein